MRQYLDLLGHILDQGVVKDDRTGTGTLSVFGYQMRIDLTQGFPLLTTKKLHLRSIIYELLWFLGFPTETRQEVLRTARYLMDHRPLFGLASFVGSYELHPDTRIHDFPEDYGVTLLGEREGRYLYTVETGMGMEEKDHLTRLFASTENRNLACNGAHLPHLVERGLDLSDIEHPMRIPEEVITFCAKEEEEA